MEPLPSISVVMAVYNGERYLGEAIESILNQTCCDFEFVIIDDGSTDRTPEILASYRKLDDRIKVHTQKNRGLIEARMLGYKLSRGKYLAHMDADDISLPGRLHEQFQYLENNPDVFVVGTQKKDIDESGEPMPYNHYYAISPGVVGWHLFFCNTIANPTIMMRRELTEMSGGYDPTMLHAEDHDLWSRANFEVKLDNLPEIFLKCRVRKDSITSVYSQVQLRNTYKIIRNSACRLLGRDISVEDAENIHRTRLRVANRRSRSHQISFRNYTANVCRLCQKISSEAGQKKRNLPGSFFETSFIEQVG